MPGLNVSYMYKYLLASREALLRAFTYALVIYVQRYVYMYVAIQLCIVEQTTTNRLSLMPMSASMLR